METGTLGVDSRVWVTANDAGTDFMPGVVSSRDGAYITVHSDKGKETFNVQDPAAQVWRANPRVVDDMTALQFFHVPGILHNLKERALRDEPYTFLGGSVLVSVNPLQDVPDPAGALGTAQATMHAHPYAMAEAAYQQLLFAVQRPTAGEKTNQSIVVGGESGAGKTESSKMVLKHLAQRSLKAGKESAALDERLVESNPILEAFGNAATKRNLASSRFGVFRRVHWKPVKGGMAIYGASVETYLLERSRVTAHSLGERTFHVFYQLCEGADKATRKALQLDQSFRLLKATADDELAKGGRRAILKSMAKVGDLGKADKDNFKHLCKALATVGVPDKPAAGAVSQADLFGVVAALLHLGNVDFAEKEGAMADEAEVSTPEPLALASKLLGVPAAALSALFIERKVSTREEDIVAKRDADSAKVALDAVVKAVYTAAFDWLVDRITESLSGNADFADYPYIGVLDIFGFETFRRNDFEQLLINYCNEALQATFNEQIFAAEADLYRREGLLVDDASRAPPPDNRAAMALLAGVKGDRLQPGILGIVDAETQSPQPSDAKLNAAIHRAYTGSKAARGVFLDTHPKDMQHCFTVQHYAGPVKYTTGHFVERNVDRLPEAVGAVMGASSIPLVAALFGGDKRKGPAAAATAARAMKKATSTIAGRFQLSIETLAHDLGETKATFIRCIKPNPRMTRGPSAAWFSADYVYKQLESLSIPQTAQVLQGGLPTRVPFKDLVGGFGKLLPPAAASVWRVLGGGDDRLFVRAMFTAFDVPADTYKVGLTRVFFRSGMLDELSAVLQAAAGAKLDAAVAERFRLAVLRMRWRTIFAKLAAFSAFRGILAVNRERNSAATILQRVAKRRAREARRRAEEARRKEEERRRAEEEALRRAEEQRRREEEERRRREAAEAAKRVQEAEQARLAELKAQQLREEAEQRAREAAQQKRALEAALAKAEQDRQAAEKLEQAERAKAEKALGGEAALAAQAKSEQTRKVRFAVADNDDEDDAPDAPPSRPLRAASGDADAVRAKAQKAGRMSMAPRKGPTGEISAPKVFTDVKYREVEKRRISLRASMTRFVGGLGALRGKGKGKDAGDGGKDKAKPKDKRDVLPRRLSKSFFADGDAWDSCAIIIHGIRLEYYKSVAAGPGGAPVGSDRLGSIELDPELTDMKEVPGATPDEKVMQFTVDRVTPAGKKVGKLIIFMMVEDSEKESLVHAYHDAVGQFIEQQKLARRYYAGNLDRFHSEEMKRARKWWLAGIISEEEFGVLVAEQITSEADVLGVYGEEAIPDFRVTCLDCSEVVYVMPGDDAGKYCENCGAPLPMSDPKEAAADALAFRLRTEEQLAARVGKGKKGKAKGGAGGGGGGAGGDDRFLTGVGTPDGTMVVEQCEITESFDPERLEKIYRFAFFAKLYKGEAAGQMSTAMDVFTFSASWSEWKYFRKALADPQDRQRETLPVAARGKIPAFPEDVAGEPLPFRRARQRMPRVQQFVVDLLAASEGVPGFWDAGFVRKGFNLPVSAAQLARAAVGVLDAEQLAAVVTFADQLVAQELGSGGQYIDAGMVQSLKAVRPSLEATTDADKVAADARLADMDAAAREQHVVRALALLETVDDLLQKLGAAA